MTTDHPSELVQSKKKSFKTIELGGKFFSTQMDKFSITSSKCSKYDRGFTPWIQSLDNNHPSALKRNLLSSNITFQLVMPHLHRTNKAKNNIGTFKDHLTAFLSSVNPSFPIHLWCWLIPLATTTLNLLQPSAINLRISTEAQLSGSFNYNITPLAPPGTKVIVHETPVV